MIVYKYLDYKIIILERIKELRWAGGTQYSLLELSNACKIQRTYLSRVLHSSKAHLNPDQLYLASMFLEFQEAERIYLELTHAFQWTSVKARKQEIKEKIEQIREKKLQVSENISQTRIVQSDASLQEYYLNPFYSLIHIGLTILKFQTNLGALAEQLGISSEACKHYVADLERMGMVEAKEGAHRSLQTQLHLSKDSPLVESHQSLQRLQSLAHLHRHHSKRESFHYNVVVSADESARTKIYELMLQLIRESNQLVQMAPPEKLYQIQIDLLKWAE